MKIKDIKSYFSSLRFLPFLVSCLLIGNMACDKFVDVPLPMDVITVESAYATNTAAEGSIRGIYASAVAGSGITGLYVNLGISADEMTKTSYSADQQNILDNKIAPGNGAITSMWNSFYNTIYQCNNAIYNLEQPTQVTAAKKDQFIGEAKFLRAFTYFYLVNLWDSVPLAITPDYEVNRLLHRSSDTAVYAKIVEDLTDAQSKLSSTLNTAVGTRSRANKWAATAMLARVKLFQKKWDEAETQASAVIGSGYYMLPPLSEVFLSATSRENIWQLTSVGSNLYTPLNYATSSVATNPPYRLTSWVTSLFTATDLRKTQWVTPTLNGVYKYKTYSNQAGPTTAESMVPLRLAEVYLIRAEARAQKGNVTGANSAEADLNMVRTRAGLPGTTATTQATMLQAIYNERLMEFFAEFGHRWLDIKRTGQADAIFSTHKSAWVHTAAFFPIPFNEIKYNPNLTQNAGY